MGLPQCVGLSCPAGPARCSPAGKAWTCYPTARVPTTPPSQEAEADFYLENQPSDKNTSNCSDHNMKKTSIATWCVNETFPNSSLWLPLREAGKAAGSTLSLQFLVDPSHFGNCEGERCNEPPTLHTLLFIYRLISQSLVSMGI